MGSDLLHSPGFVLLATVVAFNTLIYVGLTIAKVIPWPKQVPPSVVRRRLDRVGLRIKEERAVRNPPYVPAGGHSRLEVLRDQAARKGIPQAFALSGGLVMLFAITAAFFVGISFVAHLMEFAFGFGLLTTGVVFWYGDFTGRTMMRALALSSTLLVVGLVVEGVLLNAVSPIAYSLLVMTAYMPIVLDWPSSLIAGCVMLLCVTTISALQDEFPGVLLTMLTCSALLVSALLLHIRRETIVELADEQAKSAAMATTDERTGTLNRRGILTLAPMLAANAARADQPIGLALVEIAHVEPAKAKRGARYADAVAGSVAGHLQERVRNGDLVARWDDRRFVILGQGLAPDADALRSRIEDGVAASRIALGRPALTIRVGSSDGDPGADTFDGMLAVAQDRLAGGVLEG